MNHLIMLSIWLALGANPTSSPSSTDQNPLFPSNMFTLTLRPTNPLEGTAFKLTSLSVAPAVVRVNRFDKNLGNSNIVVPLLRANIAPAGGDLIDDRR